MVASAPVMRMKNSQYQNLTKKGKGPVQKKQETRSPLGPWMLGLILFVVVGGVVFELVSKLVGNGQ